MAKRESTRSGRNPLAASADISTTTARRAKPKPWTEADTRALEGKLQGFERTGRDRIPADSRKVFVEHASSMLAAQIQVLRSSPKPASHRRQLADLRVMERACDRLLDYWASTEAKVWIWAACNPHTGTPPTPIPKVRRRVSKETRDGVTYCSREEHAVLPADREECLISVPGFFVHDLRRLSLALERARGLLRGVREHKGEMVGGVIGQLYLLFRQDTGLRPLVHGPFRAVAKFAVARVFGEVLGARVLANRLRVLHAVASSNDWESDSPLLPPGGYMAAPAKDQPQD